MAMEAKGKTMVMRDVNMTLVAQPQRNCVQTGARNSCVVTVLIVRQQKCDFIKPRNIYLLLFNQNTRYTPPYETALFVVGKG